MDLPFLSVVSFPSNVTMVVVTLLESSNGGVCWWNLPDFIRILSVWLSTDVKRTQAVKSDIHTTRSLSTEQMRRSKSLWPCELRGWWKMWWCMSTYKIVVYLLHPHLPSCKNHPDPFQDQWTDEDAAAACWSDFPEIFQSVYVQRTVENLTSPKLIASFWRTRLESPTAGALLLCSAAFTSSWIWPWL